MVQGSGVRVVGSWLEDTKGNRIGNLEEGEPINLRIEVEAGQTSSGTCNYQNPSDSSVPVTIKNSYFPRTAATACRRRLSGGRS